MLGMQVARVKLLFSFVHAGTYMPCAFVHWFDLVGSEPDQDTGMWIVEPSFRSSGKPNLQVIHLDTILRAAHLLGVCGESFLPQDLSADQALDSFPRFYVNKYIDIHAHEVAF